MDTKYSGSNILVSYIFPSCASRVGVAMCLFSLRNRIGRWAIISSSSCASIDPFCLSAAAILAFHFRRERGEGERGRHNLRVYRTEGPQGEREAVGWCGEAYEISSDQTSLHCWFRALFKS